MRPSSAMRWMISLAFLSFSLISLSSGPALAHHALDGRLPETVFEGFLSGLAHPVLGPDHIAFIVGVGLLAGLSSRIWLVPLPFVAGTLAGAFIHLGGTRIPMSDLAVCGSVLAIGLAVYLQRQSPLAILAVLFAGAGVLHGYAYAENIFGAAPTALYAYLFGFAFVQYAIAIACALLFRLATSQAALSKEMTMRCAGIVISFVGITMIVSMS